MAKSDFPPFVMTVERGPRLVPATASDAERLSTWRTGSQVNVQFVRNGSRVMERKWWAVLGLVVDRCNVPWKTKEQASEAVKLALGIVNLTKTVAGAWMQYPKSLTELDDPELDAAVRDMMDLVQQMTGIDPETLRRETADVGEDEHEPASASSPSESSAVESMGNPAVPSGDHASRSDGAVSPLPDPVAASLSADEAEQPAHAAAPEAGADGSEERAEPGSASAPALSAKDRADIIKRYLGLATDTANVPDERERYGRLATIAEDEVGAIGDHAKPFILNVLARCKSVIKGELTAAKAREFLEGLS
jgi:hypothetical protein